MVRQVKVKELEAGSLAGCRISQMAQLKGSSCVTVSRDIKKGRLYAERDPQTGRIFIPADAALAYLRGEQYVHNFQDTAALERMERARQAKGVRNA